MHGRMPTPVAGDRRPHASICRKPDATGRKWMAALGSLHLGPTPYTIYTIDGTPCRWQTRWQSRWKAGGKAGGKLAVAQRPDNERRRCLPPAAVGPGYSELSGGRRNTWWL